MGQCFSSSRSSNTAAEENTFRPLDFGNVTENSCGDFSHHPSNGTHGTVFNTHAIANGGSGSVATALGDKDSSFRMFHGDTAMVPAGNQIQSQQHGNVWPVQKKKTPNTNAARARDDSLRDVEKVVALYNYESRSDGDLSFTKGDVMTLMDNSNNDWWYVKDAKGRTGYVPRTFVGLQRTLESEDWFAGRIPRSRAERLVASSNLPNGTFLIRERESDHLEYALTVRDGGDGTSHGCVKHYKIRLFDAEEGYYITTRVIFRSLKELVAYYSERADGLCCQLTFSAPRIAPIRPDLSHETHMRWEIPRNEFSLREKLGDGNFGEVWRAKWQGVVDVAIKTMKPGTMSSEAFLGEAQIMKQCDDPNLVKLYGVCTLEEPFYIVTEFMMGGSLLLYLRDAKNDLVLQALVDMCSQIANGMKYLEERKLVHRDLAARNVLVGDKISGVPIVKVADFGLARKLMEEDIYEAKIGAKFPIKWTAPEAAASGNFTVKSDVWSYGILLYEIFTRGKTPYPDMNNREVIEQVEIGHRMKCPPECPEKIYVEIMLKCWDKKPDRRPTFAFLYSYFDDYYVSSQPNYIPP